MIKKLLGIGEIFTSRDGFSRNKGKGYILPQDAPYTKNVGIGRPNWVEDPYGKIKVNGIRASYTKDKGPQPEPVPEIAPMTLRFAFSQETSNPTTLGMTKGTWVKVDNYPGYDNVWDWTYDNKDWSNTFSNKLTSSFDPDVKVIEAGDTGKVTTIITSTSSSLFYKCSGLTSVCLFDTKNVTRMSSMFLGCTSLTSVPLFDTKNVTNMSGMFYGCTSLTSVPLFDTHNVTNMGYMFGNCSSLTTVPLFNTSNVTTMQTMFENCTSLTTVPLFDTHNVTNMNGMPEGASHGMFQNCKSLTTVPLFDTSKVIDMHAMFAGCTSLTTVPLFDTSNATQFGGSQYLYSDDYGMFDGCTSLTSIPLFDTSKVTRTRMMCAKCSNVETGLLDFYKQASSTGNITSYEYTFLDAGKNTVQGRAERAYIPKSWGGDWVVPSLADITATVDGQTVTVSGTISNYTQGNTYELTINGETSIIDRNSFDVEFTDVPYGHYTWDISIKNTVNDYTVTDTIEFDVEGQFEFDFEVTAEPSGDNYMRYRIDITGSIPQDFYAYIRVEDSYAGVLYDGNEGDYLLFNNDYNVPMVVTGTHTIDTHIVIKHVDTGDEIYNEHKTVDCDITSNLITGPTITNVEVDSDNCAHVSVYALYETLSNLYGWTEFNVVGGSIRLQSDPYAIEDYKWDGFQSYDYVSNTLEPGDYTLSCDGSIDISYGIYTANIESETDTYTFTVGEPVTSHTYKWQAWPREGKGDYQQQDFGLLDENNNRITEFTTLSGTESSSSNENYPNGFDGNSNTKWYTRWFESDGSVIVTFTSDLENPTGFSYLTSGDAFITSRAPHRWILSELINDEWVVLDSNTDEDSSYFEESSSYTWVDKKFSQPG